MTYRCFLRYFKAPFGGVWVVRGGWWGATISTLGYYARPQPVDYLIFNREYLHH